MPTVLRIGGFRFHFYSHEPGEPPHIHIDSAGADCKIWLEPVAVASREMEHWSPGAEGFNFHIDCSVLADSPPPPAPVAVKRRSGGLVGAIGGFARSRRHG